LEVKRKNGENTTIDNSNHSTVALAAGVTAGLAVALYGLIGMICSLLGFIPFIGPVIYWLIMHFGVEPFVVSYVSLGAWTGVIFWLFFAISVVWCCISSFIVLSILSD